MINLFDMNNWVRRSLEQTSPAAIHHPIRSIIHDLENTEGVVVCVWDGMMARKWRTDLYPAYKGKRPPTSESIYEAFRFIQQLLELSGIMQVTMPEVEADDVIAALARHYAAQGTPISIYSTDWDFAQLVAEFPKLVFCGYAAKKPCPPEQVVLYKVFVGDTSDNIPGLPGYGPKSFDRASKPALEAVLKGSRDFTDTGITESQQRWIEAHPNQLETYLAIVQFKPLTLGAISTWTRMGERDLQRREFLMERYML